MKLLDKNYNPEDTNMMIQSCDECGYFQLLEDNENAFVCSACGNEDPNAFDVITPMNDKFWVLLQELADCGELEQWT